jgi:CheY-like chemotaxis protein
MPGNQSRLEYSNSCSFNLQQFGRIIQQKELHDVVTSTYTTPLIEACTMKKHFFLIDDDEDELAIFMEAIREIELPTKCTYAQSSEQALDMLNYLSPDFIFVDINMPGANGFDFLRKLKEKPGLVQASLIMYSNGIDATVTEKATALGANFCIPKTENIGDLINAIKNLLETVPQTTEVNHHLQ